MADATPEATPEVTPGRIAAFVVMVFGMFMAILDIQIVAASLSEIRAGLSAGPSEISWVQTSYLIAEVVMIPLSGFLGRLLSTRILFAVSAAGFTAASLLCATATSIEQIIVYRAFQGFIGGGMIPSVFAAAYTLFPRSRQGMVTAIIGLIVTVAPAVGPTIGGYLTTAASWHWLFLVNVPPGILVTIGALTLIDFDEPDWSLLRNFDYAGLAAMAVFLGTLEYVLEEGPGDDWLADNGIATLTAISAVAAAIFFYRTLRARNPVVEVRIFLNRNFAVGAFFGFVIGVGLYGLVYIFPLFLARVRDYTALQVGETVVVTGIFMMVTAPIAGRLADKIDPRLMLGVGMALLGFSCFQLEPITGEWGFWLLFWPQALRGLGLMFCMIPVTRVALGTLEAAQLKNASGLFNLMRNLGGAFGLAGINTVLDTRTDFHYARLADSISWDRPAVQETMTGLTQHFTGALGPDADLAAVRSVAGIVHRQASIMAFSDVFLVLGVIFAAGVLVVPLVSRPGGDDAPAH